MSETEKKSLTAEYFDRVYEANDDPWNFQTSEYEAGKYKATVEALPNESYANAFEIGCSIGVLTEQLAGKCENLLAVDVSDAALTAAKKRCANLPNVRFAKMNFQNEFPSGKFDLILVSEVGYYLALPDWEKAMSEIYAHLTENGQVMLVHWTPFVHDYPQTGDEVHDSFAKFAAGKMRHLDKKRAEKYRLDVWEKI